MEANPVKLQLLLFLNASKGDIELAALKLDKYYEVKHECPEFFKNRDLDSEEVQQALDTLIVVALPVSPDNCLMIAQKLRLFNPKDYNFDGACKMYIMKTEATTYQHGPRDGIIFINDLDGASFFHMFRPSMNSLRKGARVLQDAAPLEVKAIHMLNTVSFINYAMSIAKTILRSEMLNKIHFHPPNMNFDDFQQKYGIPKSHLPSDYGGALPSLEEMHTKQRKELMGMRDYFKMEEAHMNYEYDQHYEEFEAQRPKGSLPVQIKDYKHEESSSM